MASSVSASSGPAYQLYGLASGFDTKGIIDATVAAYRKPMDALQKQRDGLAFQRQVFRDVNDALYKLQQLALNLRLESTFRSKLVTSSDESVVTATADVTAARGSHSIKVNAIADSAKAFGDVVTTYQRTDLAGTAGVARAGGTAHGTTQGTHTVRFTSGLAGRVTGWVGSVELDRTLASYGVQVADGLSFDVGGRTVALTGLTKDSTVRDLLQHVNQGGTNLVADIQDGRLVITGTAGGLDFSVLDSGGNYTDSIAAKLLGATDERLSVAEVIGSRQVTATQTLAGLGVVSAGGLDIIVDKTRTHVTLALGAASTVQDLVDSINSQVSGVTARIATGRVVIDADSVGTPLQILDTNYTDDIAAQVLGLSGRQDTQGEPVNAAAVTTSASTGAHIVGGVSGVSAFSPLSSYGVTTPNGMKITIEGGSTFTFTGLSGASTVGDLVRAINSAAPGVRAQVLGGRLVLYAADGGRNFTVQDVDETENGIAGRLLGLSSPGGAPAQIAQSTAGSVFGAAGVFEASAGQNGMLVGRVPTAGAVVGANQLSFYGLADPDVAGFSVRVGTTTTNVGMTSATQTVDDLVQAIDAVGGVRAYIMDGRLVVESEEGNSDFTVSDQNYTTDIARVMLGITAERGSVAEIAGATSGLAAGTQLSALGITDASGLAFTINGQTTSVGNLTTASTVQDLIDQINNTPGLRAELTDDGRLAVRSTYAHVNFTMSDSSYAGTIGGNVFGLTRAQSTIDPSTSNATVNGAATGAAILGPSLTGGLTDALSTFAVTAVNGEFGIVYRGQELKVSFSATDTLGDLIDRINALDGVRADFVTGRLLIAGEDAREDFTVSATRTTYNAGNGFRELLGMQQQTSTTDASSGNNIVTAASTGEYTASDLVLPLAGGYPEFHAEVGREGHVLSTLFQGGYLQGTGYNQSFKTGTTNLFTTAELVAGVATASAVEGERNAGQRATFSLTPEGSPAGSALSLTANAVFEGARAATYYVHFVDSTHYVLEDANGTALGDAVLDGDKFTSFSDSPLAGSSLTFKSEGAPHAPPTTGDRWSFTLGVDVTKTLDTAGFATKASTSTNGTFTINGVAITINDYTQETVESVLAKINSAGAGVVATYDAVADQFLISSIELGVSSRIAMGSMNDSSDFLRIARIDLGDAASGGGGSQRVGVDNGTVVAETVLSRAGLSTQITQGTFTINGVKLYVNPTKDTMQDIIDRINGSAAHVKATYDAVNDRLIIENDPENRATTSNTMKVRVGGFTDTSNFLRAINLIDSTETGGEIQVGSAGTDASFVVDGISYTRTKNTVSDVITGVMLTLRGTSGGTVSLGIEIDTDRGLNAIANWIAEWNKTVDSLNPTVLTDEQKKYLPDLTDDERANMTYTQLEEYDALHKLYNTQEVVRTDTTIRRLYNSLRQGTTDPVKGLPDAYNELGDLKIEPYTPLGALVPKGHLVIDSSDKDTVLAKLKDSYALITALQQSEEDIQKLFASKAYAGSGASVSAGYSVPSTGLAMPSAGGSLKFRVGNGTQWSSVITLEEGKTYTRDQIRAIMDQAGLNVGTSDKFTDKGGVRANFNSGGAVTFSLVDTATSSSVWFEDLSEGANNLSAILGISISTAGNGLAEAMYQAIRTSTGSDGVLGSRTKAGGSLDTQIQSLDDRLSDWERRVTAKEKALNDQWTQFETELSKIQQMGTTIEQLAAVLPDYSG